MQDPRVVKVYDRASGKELQFTLVDHGRDFTIYVDLPETHHPSVSPCPVCGTHTGTHWYDYCPSTWEGK